MILRVLIPVAICFSLLAFQNCSSDTSISPSDLKSTSTPTPTPTPLPIPTPLPSPFMFQSKWKALTATNPPPPLFGHTAVSTGTQVIVWGGNDSLSTIAPAGGYLLDLTNNSWSALSGTGAPAARTKHTAVWTGSKMIVWGGIGNLTTGAALGDGGIYDPVTNTWTLISTFGPTARANHGAVWTGTEMLVWGGVDSGNNALNDGGAYNPVTNTWRMLPTAGAPSARKHPSVVWTGSKMLVWGGANAAGTTFYADGAYFDPLTNQWTALAETTPPPARQWASIAMALYNNAVYIFAGHNGSALGALFSLDVPSGVWTAIPATSGVPAPRYGHSQVMTTEGMLIWGGTDGTSVFGDGAIYY